jgi:hypothetical protein
MNRVAIIFCKTVVPASESADGETPMQVAVTQEASGHAVWRCDYNGDLLYRFFYGAEDGMGSREGALCCAVFLANDLAQHYSERGGVAA